MADASATEDLEKRADLLRQAEAVAMADMPNIPLYYFVSKDLVATHVQGWVDNIKDIHRTRWLSVVR